MSLANVQSASPIAMTKELVCEPSISSVDSPQQMIQSPQSIYLDAMDSFSSCTSAMDFETMPVSDAAVAAAVVVSCFANRVVADAKVDPFELSLSIVNEIIENSMGEKELCPVCYDELPVSLTELTDCNHRFCKCCLEKVRKTKPMCPLCRRRIGEDPPRSFAASHYENSILQLLAQLLSISHTLDRRRYIFARENRHNVLYDIFLGIREEAESENQSSAGNLILVDIDDEEEGGLRLPLLSAIRSV
eukprot:TRINITY_DN21007_c0_g1_i1.p1 TRINITY_DN21007_c0_g1~~TRINITY_DN21007_c0_g1_i1.p1  ORF type:complete len:247 (+),score=31.59 TRINITY_DN21007_c0_g1_i1:51-791(+)